MDIKQSTPTPPTPSVPETRSSETRSPETRSPETRSPESRSPETRSPESRVLEAKDLPAKTGATISASVEKVRVLSPAEHKHLLSTLSSQLKQAAVSQLSAENRAAVEAKLANLSHSAPQLAQVNIGQSRVEVLSQQNIQVGQNLLLALRADGQFNLLSAQPEPNLKAQQTQGRGNTAQTIADNLRVLLPREKFLADALRALLTIGPNLAQFSATQGRSGQLNALPANQHQANQHPTHHQSRATANSSQASRESAPLLSEKVISLLRALENNVLTQQKLQPEEIKMAIARSGVLLENKLLNAIRGQSAAHTSLKNTGVLSKGLLSPKNNDVAPVQSLPGAIKEALNTDNKALFLALDEELARLQTMPTITRIPGTPNTRVNTDPLMAILKSLGLNAGPAKADKFFHPQQFRSEIAQQIRTRVQSALARIGSLQLRYLSQSMNENLPNASPTIELSMRVQDNIYPIVLFFQEKPLREKKPDQEEKNPSRKQKSARRWNVFMEFDLDENGKMASEISFADDRLNTAFWCDSDATRNKIQARLEKLKEKLRANGLHIDEINVFPGDPPARQASIQQPLLDIET